MRSGFWAKRRLIIRSRSLKPTGSLIACVLALETKNCAIPGKSFWPSYIMIDQDSELAIYAGHIVAAGCGYLNEEHFVVKRFPT